MPTPSPGPPELSATSFPGPSKHSLNFSHLPSTYLLPTHLIPSNLSATFSRLRTYNIPLTSSPSSATFFLTAISKPARAKLELGRLKLRVVDPEKAAIISYPGNFEEKEIFVVNLRWLEECEKQDVALEWKDTKWMVMRAKVVMPGAEVILRQQQELEDSRKRKAILEAAEREGKKIRRDEERGGYGVKGRKIKAERDLVEPIHNQRPKIVRMSTSEREIGERVKRERIMPEWIREKNTFSCCRSTPMNPPYPNGLFVDQLKTISKSRYLASDHVGVRAYATSIAALRAYPYSLVTAGEIEAIPGCDGKIAALFYEWLHSSPVPEERKIAALEEVQNSQSFQRLKLFDSIWGVGPDTARKFVFSLGFKDIDDLVEGYWGKLTRGQRIGVKFFDEFMLPIGRALAEDVAGKVHEAAKKETDGEVEMRIVGGYRRGAESMHDIDVLLSHREEGMVDGDFLVRLVKRLEDGGRGGGVSHTLSLSYGHEEVILGESESQWKGGRRHGFDKLDKAMVVWVDGEGVHRRVDIIVAGPVCAGTGLLGWSGGTTFQRDLRKWCEKRGWKFGSEGVWKGEERVRRVEGTWGWREEERWEEVEKRVMEVIGVGWREPGERCTG